MPRLSIKDPVVSANDHWDNLFKSECSLLHANLQNSLSELPPKTTQSLSSKSEFNEANSEISVGQTKVKSFG